LHRHAHGVQPANDRHLREQPQLPSHPVIRGGDGSAQRTDTKTEETMQKKTSTIVFMTISLLPAAALAQAAQPAAPVRDSSQSSMQFRSDEAAVVAGLPALERVATGEFKGALAFNHEEVKDPWYIYIGKDKVKLLWNTNGVDDQKVFTFDQAIAVASKNICGAELKLNYKHKKGRVGACRYVWTVEGERWTTTTVVLSPGDQQQPSPATGKTAASLR